MNNIKLFCLVFVVAISLVSCNKNDSIKYKVSSKAAKKIDVAFKEEINFNFFVKTIRFHNPETTDYSLVSSFKKVFFLPHIIVTLSWSSDNQINIYDKEGHYINRINAKGRGPGEFIDMEDIQVDSLIRICDRVLHKLVTFNLKGELISEKYISDCFDFMQLNDTLLITTHGWSSSIDNKEVLQQNVFKNHKFNLFDTKGNVLLSLFPIDERRSNFQNFNFRNYLFQLNRHCIYTWNMANDTIYSINPDSLTYSRAFVFNFGKHSIPSELPAYKFKGLGQYKNYLNENDYCYLNEYLQIKNFHILICTKKGKKYVGISDNKSNTIDLARYMVLKNNDRDIKLRLTRDIDFVGNTDSSLLFSIESSKLKKIIEENKLDNFGNIIDSDSYNKIKKTLSLEDNPVIIEMVLN